MHFLFYLPKTIKGIQEYRGCRLLIKTDSFHTNHVFALKHQDIAQIYYGEACKHHGTPQQMISDRDTGFTFNLWTELVKLLQLNISFSTAFRRQTDGQYERGFSTTEEMLRCFVCCTQNGWDEYVPDLKFNYSKHTNESTKQVPIFLVRGEHPFSILDIMFPDSSESFNESAINFVADKRKATKLAKISTEQANSVSVAQ